MQTAHERATAIAGAARLGRVLRAARRGEAMDDAGDLVAALVDVAPALADDGIAYAVIGGARPLHLP